MNRMRQRLQGLAYANSLYQMMISGPVPKVLKNVPTDAWPGDAKAGQKIIEGEFTYAGQHFSANPPDWLPENALKNWRQMVHGFGWLRDLRAVGGDAARRRARQLMAAWLDTFSHWAVEAWDPPIMADRITHIIGMHDFFLISAESDFRERVFEMIVRQLRHLLRIIPGSLGAVLEPDPHKAEEDAQANAAFFSTGPLQGYDLIRVLRGFIYAGVALPDGEKALAFALSVLPAILRHGLSPDGLVRERNPYVQARVTKCLIDMRHALKITGVNMPPELPLAIEKACQALRIMRYGDGALALFHGGQEDDPLFIDAIFTMSDSRSRATRSLPSGGFERMAAGRTLMLVDVGKAPMSGAMANRYASLSSFELCVGRERLFVNCGAHPGGDHADWGPALAARAAHTTLGFDEVKSESLVVNAGFNPHAQASALNRYTREGKHHLEFSHDGFKALGVLHQRLFTLAENGDVLDGQDQLQGPEGLAYTLRFHLHPLVQANLIQNGQAVLMRLPSGIGFRLRLDQGAFTLEESVYFGRLSPRKTVQIVYRGRTRAGATLIPWELTREGKVSIPKEKEQE